MYWKSFFLNLEIGGNRFRIPEDYFFLTGVKKYFFTPCDFVVVYISMEYALLVVILSYCNSIDKKW